MDEVTIEVVETPNTETETTQETQNESVNQPEKVRLVRLPLARIKHIMKMDPDVSLASQDSVALVTKATEMFIEQLARESARITINSKRKLIMKKDVDTAIDIVPQLCFLDGALE